MKIEVKMGLESEQFHAIGKFARQENIDEKQAIRWLIDEGLKSFNGADKQTKLQAARIHGDAGKKERKD